jgi:hypothetical protein
MLDQLQQLFEADKEYCMPTSIDLAQQVCLDIQRSLQFPERHQGCFFPYTKIGNEKWPCTDYYLSEGFAHQSFLEGG